MNSERRRRIVRALHEIWRKRPGVKIIAKSRLDEYGEALRQDVLERCVVLSNDGVWLPPMLDQPCCRIVVTADALEISGVEGAQLSSVRAEVERALDAAFPDWRKSVDHEYGAASSGEPIEPGDRRADPESSNTDGEMRDDTPNEHLNDDPGKHQPDHAAGIDPDAATAEKSDDEAMAEPEDSTQAKPYRSRTWSFDNAFFIDRSSTKLDEQAVERVAQYRRELVVDPEFGARQVRSLQSLHPSAQQIAGGVRLIEADGSSEITWIVTIDDDGALGVVGGNDNTANLGKAIELRSALRRADVPDADYVRLSPQLRSPGNVVVCLSPAEQTAGETGLWKTDVLAKLPDLPDAVAQVEHLRVPDDDGALAASRRRVKIRPEEYFRPPLFGALVRLRLDLLEAWNRFVQQIGERNLPDGFKKRVSERVREAENQRKAESGANANSTIGGVKVGREFDALLDRARLDQAYGLDAPAIDIVLAIKHSAKTSRREAEKAIEVGYMGRGDGEDLIDRAGQVLEDVFERLRQCGVRIGLLKFRLAVAIHIGNGKAVVEWLEQDGLLKPAMRLDMRYDEEHPDEMADFAGEAAASLPSMFYSGGYVAVVNEDDDKLPRLHRHTAASLVDAISRQIDFHPSPGMRERGLPLSVGRVLTQRAAKADWAVMTEATPPHLARGMRLPRVIRGLASCPIIGRDGSIVCTTEGFDAQTKTYVVAPPPINVPERPTLAEAISARQRLRGYGSTFLFANEGNPQPDEHGILHNDLEQSPGSGENGMLALLLTMVTRPSLDIAPGYLVRGAQGSGAGAGKGKLVRACSLIAHGRGPSVLVHSGSDEEDEKRLIAAVMRAPAVISCDNWNGVRVESATISTLLSEANAEVRPLGQSKLHSAGRSVICINGNDLRTIADNANRFIELDFDPRVEDPEARPFDKHPDLLAEALRLRSELLSDAFTILRFSAQHRLDQQTMPRGKRSRFPQWDRLVRDPLLLGGGADVIERHAETKARDPGRQRVDEIFALWWEHHGDAEVAVAGLAEPIRRMFEEPGGHALKPNVLGRKIERLVGQRQSGWHLDDVTPADLLGRRPRARKYRLLWTGAEKEHPPVGAARQEDMGWGPTYEPPPAPDEPPVYEPD